MTINVNAAVSNDNNALIADAKNPFNKSLTNKPTDIVGPDDEIEIKDVLNLDPHGGDKAFCKAHGLKYPTEIFFNALVREGICVSGDGEKPQTKNLVSYYYDTVDRMLNKMRISLRMRHEETPTGVQDEAFQSYGFQPSEPDLSFKIPLTQQGDNSRRLEYENGAKLRAREGGFKFVMTFQHLVEKYTTRLLESDGAQSAAMWAREVYRLFEFNWNNFREHFSINCKRTQPYARVFTLIDGNGDNQRDEDGKIAIHTNNADWREQKLKGFQYKAIVFQFCLDTNRYFAVTEKDGCRKIACDHEVEFELQTKTCDYTVNAIKSDDGVTYEEAWVAAAHLKNIVRETMEHHNVGQHDLTGLSKQERGFIYIDDHNRRHPENPIVTPDHITVRGRNDLHTVETHNYEEMVAAVPALKQAHQEIARAKKEPKRVIA